MDGRAVDRDGAGSTVDEHRVPTARRHGHGPVEREHALVCLPLKGDGAPEESLGADEVAARDRTPDVAAADGGAIDLEGLDDDEVETLAIAELANGFRRPASLVPERGVGGHEKPREVRSATYRGEEIVVGRVAHRVIEVLDDRDVDAGVGQASDPLVGMEQERRSGTREDLVRMVVEGDHAGMRAAGQGFTDQVVQEVDVALVQPVEDADDREDRPVLEAQPLDARNDIHHAPTDAGRSAALTRTLSGASRPPPAGIAMATSRPDGSTSR